MTVSSLEDGWVVYPDPEVFEWKEVLDPVLSVLWTDCNQQNPATSPVSTPHPVPVGVCGSGEEGLGETGTTKPHPGRRGPLWYRD